MSRAEEPRRHADRAAQFMPFAALTGYYDLVRERERVTEPRREPSEEEAARISAELASVRKGQLVRVTHYERDAYVTTEGIVTRIDLAARELTVVRRHISFNNIWRVA
ncbi:MAG TPA: YolD-like family protein [Candidatus Olsenella stercoravium]|uniref:YolD-like family protein n=1 Tax=Candidatus Olsenella stercoravium TaxID=2838713 RepID=A0A9D2DLW0_9ACTN|nr:YolD-like family protein [Candidatus Olsenella stercoravium]